MLRGVGSCQEAPLGKEAVDEAALRELFEETGKLGIAKAIDNDLIDGGSVVFVEVQTDLPTPDPWESNDPSIGRLGGALYHQRRRLGARRNREIKVSRLECLD